MVQWLCFFKHELKLNSKQTQLHGVTTISRTVHDSRDSTDPPADPEDSDQEDDDDTAAGFCCWKGCITVSLAVFLFFIVFPAGILMITYSDNIKDPYVLIGGVLLTVLPLFVLIVITIVIFHRRKLIKRERQKHKQASSS